MAEAQHGGSGISFQSERVQAARMEIVAYSMELENFMKEIEKDINKIESCWESELAKRHLEKARSNLKAVMEQQEAHTRNLSNYLQEVVEAYIKSEQIIQNNAEQFK